MEPRIQMLPGAIGILVSVLAFSLHPAATDFLGGQSAAVSVPTATGSAYPTQLSERGDCELSVYCVVECIWDVFCDFVVLGDLSFFGETRSLREFITAHKPHRPPSSARFPQGVCPRFDFAELSGAEDLAADDQGTAGRAEFASPDLSKPVLTRGLSPGRWGLSPGRWGLTPCFSNFLFSFRGAGVCEVLSCYWSALDLFYRSTNFLAEWSSVHSSGASGSVASGSQRFGNGTVGAVPHKTVRIDSQNGPLVRSVIVVTSHDLSGAAHDFEIAFNCQPASPLVGADVGLLSTDHGRSARGISGSIGVEDTVDEYTVDEVLGVRDSKRPSLRPPEAEPRLAPERRFFRPQFGDAGTVNRLVIGTLICRRNRVAVYGDSTCQAVAKGADVSSVAHRILRVLSDDVLLHVEQELHPVADVDEDGGLAILITDLDNRSLRNEVPIRGVVRGSDFLDERSAGYGDQLYVDRDLPDSNGELRALLAHELSHAAIYSWQREQMLGRGLSLEETQELLPGWLHEAMAHCVELDFEPDSVNFSDRRQAFFRAPANAPIVTNERVVPFQVRRAGARAAATLFVKDVLGGEAPLNVLLNAEHRPIARFELISGTSFGEVIRRWGVQHAVRCLGVPPREVDAEICGNPPVVPSGPVISPEVFGTADGESARQSFRLKRSVRGTASFFLSVDSVVTSATVVAEPAAGITVSSVTRMGDEVIVRLLSGPEVDSVAKTLSDHRKSIPEDSAMSLPKRPTPERSDLRAEFEETTF